MHAADAEVEDIAKLRNMAREFTEGFNTGNIDRIMHFYGDVYVDVNLRHPVQRKQERAAYYAQVIRRGGFRVDVQPDEIVIQGEFAFVRGRILLVPKAAAGVDPGHTELRYLEIARKLPDGSWIAMWGMDGPVQEYEPAQ